MLQTISRQTLHRLPLYINYLKSLPDHSVNVSATRIAEELGFNDVQVRKDLAAVSSGGRPKVGYATAALMHDIQNFLGQSGQSGAVIVGMGHLGRALAHYKGFEMFGVEIVAAFDCKPELAGSSCNGRRIFPAARMEHLCKRLNVRIAILTVPPEQAQLVCDRLVQCGVKGIWNFAPVHLSVPEDVYVTSEDIGSSLGALSRSLHANPKGGASQKE